jgi:hypothetical protein
MHNAVTTASFVLRGVQVGVYKRVMTCSFDISYGALLFPDFFDFMAAS